MTFEWQNKQVIVTGGGGFLGSRVVARLRARGLREDQLVVPRREAYDLREWAAVEQLFDEAAARWQGEGAPKTIVIHLAANVGGIGYNREKPGDLFYDNAMMGLQIMEVARRRGVEKFVSIGTVCAYPKYTPIPFQENDLWNGYPEETNAPYGLAKKMLLVQGQAYRQQHNFNAIYLLPVNLYGPGDNFDPASSHVIPALIRKFVEAQAAGAGEVVVWGDGSPTREFLYVDDAAEAIVLATEQYDGAEPVNLGSSYEISIRDLAEKIAHATGFAGSLVWDTSKPNGQPRRKLDVSRAQALFGFRSETPFEVGLAETVRWYRAQMLVPTSATQ